MNRLSKLAAGGTTGLSVLRPQVMFRLATAMLLLAAGSAQANVIATFTERSTDVLLEMSGSLDLAPLGSDTLTGSLLGGTLLGGSGVRVGTPGTYDAVTYYTTDYYAPFASGFVSGSYLSGMNIAFDNNGSEDQIRVPASYVSGAFFTNAGSFAGDFAAIGITSTATVVMNLPGDQTLTVLFQRLPEGVPSPAPFALLLGGVAGLGLAGLIRRGRPRRLR